MTTLTEKFTALENQIADEATVRQTTDDNIYALLGNMSDTLTTMQDNNARNTRYILQAIGQLTACTDCPLPSRTTDPTDPKTRPIRLKKCKRAQKLAYVLNQIMTVMDILSVTGIFVNTSVVTDAIGQVITALAEPSDVPLPSYTEAWTIFGDSISYAAENIFLSNTLVGLFSAVYADLPALFYAASSPEAAQSAYRSSIESAGFPAAATSLIEDLGYNELFSFYLDPANDVNLDGYDGTVCGAPGGCYSTNSIGFSNTPGHEPELIGSVWPSSFAVTNYNYSGVYYTAYVLCTQDLDGARIQVTSGSGVHLSAYDNSTGTVVTRFEDDLTEAEVTISGSTNLVLLYCALSSGPFEFNVCLPG